MRLSADVNRILYVRNLPFKITPEELYELFGQYGPIRQIRVGDTGETKGTAYVVYEDIMDAKIACEKLSGYNVMGRYLICVYHTVSKTATSVGAALMNPSVSVQDKQQAVKMLQQQYAALAQAAKEDFEQEMNGPA